MDYLLIHQNFPGQFRHIARALAADGHTLLAVGAQTAPGLGGLPLIRYQLKRGTTKGVHRYVAPLENGVIYGQSVAEALVPLKEKGFRPDIMLAHPGWGEALFLKELFPQSKLVSFFEFFYHARGADVGFDPMFPASLDDYARVRTKNALHLLNLEACDLGISPTQWQKSLHPAAYRSKIEVIHEGVDTELMRPDESAVFSLPNGEQLRKGDPVLTYVSRNLEPYRGFHVFMRALPDILASNPSARAIIVGGDEVSYGSKPKDAVNWKEKLLGEVGDRLDMERVFFLGKIPYERYRRLLQVSMVHVYLTYPFVLSWSMLEAMSCGCLVIGSNTAPVQEVIEHGRNGVLVDFFDSTQLCAQVTEALRNPGRFEALRRAARLTVTEAYSIERGIQGYKRLLGC